ncbi:WXG100 family type VII secretion target [Spirillospora sp. CA-255316]
MTNELRVDTGALKRSGGGFKRGAGSLRRIHTTLEAALSAEGKCWGNDKTGQEFEKNYLKPSQDVLKLFGQLAEGLEQVREGVEQMAKQYSSAEDAATIRKT